MIFLPGSGKQRGTPKKVQKSKMKVELLLGKKHGALFSTEPGLPVSEGCEEGPELRQRRHLHAKQGHLASLGCEEGLRPEAQVFLGKRWVFLLFPSPFHFFGGDRAGDEVGV